MEKTIKITKPLAIPNDAEIHRMVDEHLASIGLKWEHVAGYDYGYALNDFEQNQYTIQIILRDDCDFARGSVPPKNSY